MALVNKVKKVFMEKAWNKLFVNQVRAINKVKKVLMEKAWNKLFVNQVRSINKVKKVFMEKVRILFDNQARELEFA